MCSGVFGWCVVLSSHRFVRLASEAGVPKGVINIVNGAASHRLAQFDCLRTDAVRLI